MKTNRKLLSVAVLLLLLCVVLGTMAISLSADDKATLTGSFEKTPLVEELLQTSDHYIVVKQKQLGGSHYAYTDALAETNGDPAPNREYVFEPGAELVILLLTDNGDGTVSTYEEKLLASSRGVIRDPDVSADGSKVLFSYKKTSNDDYHLYEMDLATREMTQLTFGSGQSDIEPKYLPSGDIVFTSNRCVQTVDCWYTPVCNLYILYREQNVIVRVSNDQVHDTYPTVTSDGRVLYTRWDYNDRNQMFVQALFQMLPDGSNQTEVYGNDSDFPTTLLHSRDIPGADGKYISIASGHHMHQFGKLVIIDTAKGRNDPTAVSYVFPDQSTSKKNSVDTDIYNKGKVYKYPYALSENAFLVSVTNNYSGAKTAFDICLMNTDGESVTLVKGSVSAPASQIVPIKTSERFVKTGSVNYAETTGSFYVADVYAGEGMKGVERGSAKYLRVVELVYREAAIGATVGAGTGTSDPYSPIAAGNGAWDVKAVLGIVPVEEDGSVFFRVPAKKPVYFQLLDENGCVIQTMRSWSTLQPNEIFSCVGCHEEKNLTATAGTNVTLALQKGEQELQPDLWMVGNPEYEGFDPYKDDAIGFSYLRQVQTILDASCVSCHSDTEAAFRRIDADKMTGAEKDIENANYLITPRDIWELEIESGTKEAYAPFGKITATQTDIGTVCKEDTITVHKTIRATQYDVEACDFSFKITYSGEIALLMGGKPIYQGSSETVTTESVSVSPDFMSIGENTVTIIVTGGTGYLDASLYCGLAPKYQTEFFAKGGSWRYLMTGKDEVLPDGWQQPDYDDGSWETGLAPFGDRNNDKTKWNSEKLLWLRREFTVDDLEALKQADFSANIWYDDNVHIYLNGNEVYSDGGWIDAYSAISLAADASMLRQGKNVIAVSLGNSGSYGGSEFDMSFYADVTPVSEETRETTAQISFESYPMGAKRMCKAFPLSYLVLTGSRPNGSIQWVGNITNRFANWISSMSQCEIMAPYTTGAFKSGIIEKLRTGHGGLTEAQIRAIECWIDLGVPCYADYQEGSRWDGNLDREYEEKSNKRAFYDTMDDLAVQTLAGETAGKGSIHIEYTPKGGKSTQESSGNGYAILYTDCKYSDGDKLKITLPEGEKYLAVSLSSRMGESILYLPDGVWEYTFADLEKVFPDTMNPKTPTRDYTENTIVARLVSDEELTEEHNLALNPYDQTTDKAPAYPHVTADNYYGKQAEFAPRNAIDGFTANDAHGTWPYQSWGPENSDRHNIKVDFGREVVLNELQLFIRADFESGHDTYYTSVTVELSDGTKLTAPLYKTADAITIDLGGVATEWVRLNNFVRAEKTWAAITELRAIGYEAAPATRAAETETVDARSNIPAEELVSIPEKTYYGWAYVLGGVLILAACTTLIVCRKKKQK